jgi:hypothetical protein
MKKLVTLMVLVLAAGALAQPVDPDPDMVGVYFDTDATVFCNEAPPLYTPLNAYICFTNITASSGLSGWEAHLTIDPAPAIPPTYTLSPGALNVSTAPDFVVGLSSPMGWAPAMAVLTITVTPLAATPTNFYLNGATVSSFGGFPGYAAGDDPGDLRSCGLAGGPAAPDGPGSLCAQMFVPCPGDVTATEEGTWGNVKAMFR